VSEEYQKLSLQEFAALGIGHAPQIERLRSEGRWVVETPFSFTGKGPILLYIASDGRQVRFSEGGGLLSYLESQGMDLSMDPVLSKTAFHALKETPGTAVGSGEVFLQSTPERAPQDMWRFLQAIIEVAGLRHSKYKDALVQLARIATTSPQAPTLPELDSGPGV
jgi:hypothetical protein